MAAGGLGIYGAASAPEQFRKHLSFIKNFFTTSSSSPTTDLIALFTTTPTPTLLKPSSFQKQLQILAPKEVEARLAQNQQLFRVVPNHSRDKQRKEYENLTLGYSIKRVASNNPIEDILSRHVVRAKDGSLDKSLFSASLTDTATGAAAKRTPRSYPPPWPWSRTRSRTRAM
ncbi:hypothetical protein MVEG_07694 [Podila verticillata NRRL 6337]|nr:hypothetical protein MVEG_07694 [Podila verticillata NRRL 6337]